MSYQNKITRTVNMDRNDGLSIYDNTMAAQQHHNAFEVFYNFLNKIKPARILEIGTALGGFTRFLKLVSNECGLNYEILSYDIESRQDYDDIRSLGIDLRLQDIFAPNYSTVDPYVVNYIQQPGITLVLCDGGYKIQEFNLLAPYLKKEDYIMAHDYAHDSNYFNQNINGKIWNWHEIEYSQIENTFNEQNLTVIDSEIFSSVVWICAQK